MDYIGEHLLPGQLGHFFIVLSLVASLVATFAYYKASRSLVISDGDAWKKLARAAFIIEVVSVFAIFGILFYIIYNHLFEYKYAWQHSSLSLEFKYLLACFWEGQEGSFLLWSIWHCVLGLVLIKTGKTWEAPVMTVLSFAQFCLATMIAGIYLFGHKIGSNPFLLLRDSGVLDNAPALHVDFDLNQPLKSDYLASIKDGNDLNPLLQNYWMVIHPPVLFLGFASTIIPFGFAIAGLMTKRFGDWVKQALPWALFSAAVLGVGIMMGAMWAYESLTFGGYWAWDPVENASLVPWLILIAGIHTLLIYKHTGHSLRSTYLFFILSFGFVLYSTFLTRSGILGDSSVHAFTDLGMNTQLYLFLYLFFWLPAVVGAKTVRQRMTAGITALVLLGLSFITSTSGTQIGSLPIAPLLSFITLLAGIGFIIYQVQVQVPTIHKEESGSSREFWMFIGSLVFFLSAIVIISKTSLPVLNKIFAIKKANPENNEYSYNQIMVLVAIIVAFLTAITQYFKYKETNTSFVVKKLAVPTIISIVAAALVLAFGNVNYTKESPGFTALIWIAVACSVYAIVANAGYIWAGLKGKLKVSGGSIAHVGFGMVLLGILVSSSKKEILSNNTTGILFNFGEESKENPGENLTLIKGVKTDMGTYWVTYESDSAHPKKQLWFYKVNFERKDGKENFVLYPNAFVNYKGQEGLMANPSSRHYLDHDVFTYVTALPDPEKQKKDTASFRTNLLKEGDSLFYSNGFIILNSLTTEKDLPKEIFGEKDSVYLASFKVYAKTGSIYSITSKLAYTRGEFFSVPDTITAESIVLQPQKMNPGRQLELGIKESNAVMKYITLKAYKFPFINLLWLGVVVTAIGILMSMIHRISQNRRLRAVNLLKDDTAKQ